MRAPTAIPIPLMVVPIDLLMAAGGCFTLGNHSLRSVAESRRSWRPYMPPESRERSLQEQLMQFIPERTGAVWHVKSSMLWGSCKAN